MASPLTAAMLAIGDEILSGRTKDKNIAHLAEVLTSTGIDLKEVRIVGDEEHLIVDALNTLRSRYDYVFTSGGIGPTHDDITADAVAVAFGLCVENHPEAFRRLADHYLKRGMEFTPARQRMARTPVGASLIDNAVSVAPGFRLQNVYVMAGVPAVFQSMLAEVVRTLPAGIALEAVSIDCSFGEGDVGDDLRRIASAHEAVAIGSYPRQVDGRFSTEIVVRSRDKEAIHAAVAEVRAMLEAKTTALGSRDRNSTERSSE